MIRPCDTRGQELYLFFVWMQFGTGYFLGREPGAIKRVLTPVIVLILIGDTGSGTLLLAVTRKNFY